MNHSALLFSVIACALALDVGIAHAATTSAPKPASDFPSLDSYYPMAAVRAGQQGTATVHVCVDSKGNLTRPPALVETSGNDTLDSGAIALATAGSGHYVPAMTDGVAGPGCGSFRIAFKLRGNPGLPTTDPRFPTIGARISKLNDELTRRIESRLGELGRPPVMDASFLSGGQAAERMIRQYARAWNSCLDEVVGMSADFLDDVDYLQESPDIPESERAVFKKEWPENRAALVANFREMVGSVREIVRITDELGDYVAFSVPRRTVSDSGEAHVPAADPQLTAIRERAKAALEKLQNAIRAAGATPPAPPP